MYRIVFDTDGGVWIVQLSRWGLIWRTVSKKLVGLAGEKATYARCEFDTYGEAAKYADDRGLSNVYTLAQTERKWAAA